MSLDPDILRAWATARSVARGLAVPVADRGGLRVDTNTDAEIARWIFPEVTNGLRELGRTIDAPGYLLKLCGTAEDLRGTLPAVWQLQAPAYFMVARGRTEEQPLPSGYAVQASRDGPVVTVRIVVGEDELAGSGYAAETNDAFIYDRVVTQPGHRRKGLARAMMSALGQAKRNPILSELLVATGDGCALYASLGWHTLSPYSTAAIPLAYRAD